MTDALTACERYRRAADQGKALTLTGDFKHALAAYAEAKLLARELGDRKRFEAALLNISMVLIQLGRSREGEEGLREILLRTSDDRTAFTAAYNLASSLRKQGRHERALRYARRAMDKARDLDAKDLRATAHNLFGNILLNQSYLDEALEEYKAARALHAEAGDANEFSLAILEENVGYCLLMQRRLDDGIATLERALERAVRVGDRRCETECRQDLCYGRMLQERYEEAAAHGVDALAAATEHGFDDIVENCHYLLGEMANRTGDDATRDAHFSALQTAHPELPFLKDFLCSVDVTSLITLKR